MKHCPRFCLLLVFLGLSGCIVTKEGGERDTGGEEPDTSVDTGSQDTDDIWDDTGCEEPEGDMGVSHEQADPRVVAQMGTLTFSATSGHYFMAECATSINATAAGDGTTAQKLVIDLEGSVDYAGSYNIITLTLMEQKAQAGNNWEYTVQSPSGVTFDVSGFGPNQTIFGALSGPVTLEGGGESPEMGSLVIEGWGQF